jgi:hypothetical protein
MALLNDRVAPTMHETAWEVFGRRDLAGQPFADMANRLQISSRQAFSGLT